MDWKAYLAGLTGLERQRAEALVNEFSEDVVSRNVRYYPTNSLDELEDRLRKGRQKVREQVPNLYESIDIARSPVGWRIKNNIQNETDGTRIVQSDVTGPNGATGFFERGYNADKQRIELRNAFLRLPGTQEELPTWINGIDVPLVASRGTPTVQYFTFYQFKLLGVPAGQIRWWRRLLHRARLRSGPFAALGLVTSIKMSTIQNVESIVHLHWLQQQHPKADLSELIAHTASVEYAETTAVQCGYRLARIQYTANGEWEGEIELLLDHFDGKDARRASYNDRLLSRYSADRHTVMKQNFEIELSILFE